MKRPGRRGWPRKERIFYVLAKNGLHVGRNTEFFRSCAPARTWPAGLEEQESFLHPRFPKISRRLFERVVGFFDRIAELHDAEAAVLLVWDRRRRRVGVFVPDQTATVFRTWSGKTYPLGVEYFPPPDLAEHLAVLGDIHSHVDYSAYRSQRDVADEQYRAGLHVVVGRIDREPPEIHVEAVADGTRFDLDEADVIGGYRLRNTDIPEAWIRKVAVEHRSSFAAPPKPAGRRKTDRQESDRRQSESA